MTNLKKISGRYLANGIFTYTLDDDTAERTQDRNELVTLIRVISLVRAEIGYYEERF